MGPARGVALCADQVEAWEGDLGLERSMFLDRFMHKGCQNSFANMTKALGFVVQGQIKMDETPEQAAHLNLMMLAPQSLVDGASLAASRLPSAAAGGMQQRAAFVEYSTN